MNKIEKMNAQFEAMSKCPKTVFYSISISLKKGNRPKCEEFMKKLRKIFGKEIEDMYIIEESDFKIYV